MNSSKARSRHPYHVASIEVSPNTRDTKAAVADTKWLREKFAGGTTQPHPIVNLFIAVEKARMRIFRATIRVGLVPLLCRGEGENPEGGDEGAMTSETKFRTKSSLSHYQSTKSISPSPRLREAQKS